MTNTLNYGTQKQVSPHLSSSSTTIFQLGQCKGKYLGDALPYCVTFNPDPTKQPIFLCGRSDKKIVQYDSRTSEIVQDYDEHQGKALCALLLAISFPIINSLILSDPSGPVNTITFINNNTQFASTSDDKSIKVWEFGLPIVVKNIAEQYMHAITAVSLHPSSKRMTRLFNSILFRVR